MSLVDEVAGGLDGLPQLRALMASGRKPGMRGAPHVARLQTCRDRQKTRNLVRDRISEHRSDAGGPCQGRMRLSFSDGPWTLCLRTA